MIEILKPEHWASFWSKVSSQGSCWVWTGYKERDGYGVFAVHISGTKKSIPFKVYRLSYTLIKGEIPKGMQIDHLCRNRGCLNPDHLEVVTCKENVLRGNGLCAINKKKTHCPQGHEYNLTNTYYDKNGGRYCNICRAVAREKYLQKKRSGCYLH